MYFAGKLSGKQRKDNRTNRFAYLRYIFSYTKSSGFPGYS